MLGGFPEITHVTSWHIRSVTRRMHQYRQMRGLQLRCTFNHFIGHGGGGGGVDPLKSSQHRQQDTALLVLLVPGAGSYVSSFSPDTHRLGLFMVQVQFGFLVKGRPHSFKVLLQPRKVHNEKQKAPSGGLQGSWECSDSSSRRWLHGYVSLIKIQRAIYTYYGAFLWTCVRFQ